MMGAAKRVELVLDSGFAVQQHQRCRITYRLSMLLDVYVFRPGTFHIDNAIAWTIHDFKIGHHSQLKRPDINATQIEYELIEPRKILDASMDLAMEVSWQREGESIFHCVIVGNGA